MIRLPQRSVTRFFIPLIDVLTLLFAVFLLLPVVKPPEGTEEDLLAREKRLREQERELENKKAGGEMTRELSEEIEKLRKEKGKALQERLAVRVLEIDGQTGKLYYRDPILKGDRQEVPDRERSQELINRDRREYGVGQRELYYLILYPRDPASLYPTRGQREKYDSWFEGVALGYDVPGKGPARR
jgi:hypothetical protein